MPIVTARLKPGVNVEATPTLLESGVARSNRIRFRDGLIEKLGGWLKFYAFSIGSIIRDLHAWQDLNLQKWLGIGAEESLTVLSEGVLRDITPRTRIADVTVDFSTVDTSNVVTIEETASSVTIYDSVFIATPVSVGGIVVYGFYPIETAIDADRFTVLAAGDATATVNNAGVVPEFDTTIDEAEILVTLPNHGLLEGGSFYFFVETLVGGLSIFGNYEIIDVPSVDEFVIRANEQATSTQNVMMNGGDVRLIYYISIGPLPQGSGYGVEGYGEGGYGYGVDLPTNPGSPIGASDWTMDNWGQILLSCPAEGGIYRWTPGGTFTTAQLIEEAPLVNGGIFVAMPQQILVAWASSFDSIQDTMLVRWCDVSNFFSWIAQSVNQAGSFRIPKGSEIVGGLQGPRQALLWTDVGVWQMQYVQPPEVWGFIEVGSGCGLVGPHAAGVLGNRVYWMNQGGFFILAGGGAAPLPCSVWDVVYQDLDRDNIRKVRCAPNSMFNEISWFYPSLSGGTGECDKYVKFNAISGEWDYGTLDRSAWEDQSVLGEPLGATIDGFIYQHEVAKDDDGAQMGEFFESGYIVLQEGQDFPFLDLIIPDFKYGFVGSAKDAQVLVTIMMVDYPEETPRIYGPFTITEASRFINTRARGRQVAVRVESQGLDGFWRTGAVRFRIAQSGRR